MSHDHRNTNDPITITHGTNRLAEPLEVPAGSSMKYSGRWTASSEAPPMWDGHAGERIAGITEALVAKFR